MVTVVPTDPASPSRFRDACDALHDGTEAARRIFGWASGVPGRLVGKEAAWLLADAARFAVADLPPVLLGRTADLSRALLSVRMREVVHDPKKAAACATHKALDLMGGGFVKMAQVVAHSPALFPEPLVRACRGSLAQAVTPPAPLKDIEQILKEDLGLKIGDLFEDFEVEPMAAASIAQVHAARLRSGERCVVKVVRPRVRERLAVDFACVQLAARLADLILGEEVVLQLVSASLEGCVEELRRAVMAECDLAVERQNIEDFSRWLETSATLRRARLADAVRVPKTYEDASSSRILTMERIDGLPFSELYEGGSRRSDCGDWQAALTSALSVAAVSVIDGSALFHADLHTGNMIAVRGPGGECRVAFIDFGCCGRLPAPLRGTLLMQASAFAGGRPDVRQFCEGFAHALQRIPELGREEDLDVDALATDMKPVLKQLQLLNPFRGGDPMSPELHIELLRLQRVLCRHGVQLPREFTLLMKTGCFGALYFSLLDDANKRQLLSKLLVAGAAFAASHPKDARQLLNPARMAVLLSALRSHDRSCNHSSVAGAASAATQQRIDHGSLVQLLPRVAVQRTSCLVFGTQLPLFHLLFGNQFVRSEDSANGDVSDEASTTLEPVPGCTRPDGSAPAVHAAFYLWYGTPEVDGKWLHWDHKVLPHWDKEVDAKYDKFNWSPPDEPHATFYPERGPYSSRDESILTSQFEDLAKAGVDSAMCSWWGRKDWTGKRDDADSGANTDELIPSVLQAAEQAGVFVSFHIEPYGGRSPQTFLDDLAYIVREYGRHPAIWREGPNKLPLFWLYDVSAQHSMQDVAAWKMALDSVRDTELDGVFLCLWIGNGGGREDLRFVQDGGFDGAYTYFAAEGFTPGSNTKSWKDTAARLKKVGKLFVPSVGPGYDDTRVRPWNSHNIRERKGGEYYNRMWSAAVGSRPHAVSVTSYNEWGEGTQIEPAKRHRSWKGAKYGSYEPKPPLSRSCPSRGQYRATANDLRPPRPPPDYEWSHSCASCNANARKINAVKRRCFQLEKTASPVFLSMLEHAAIWKQAIYRFQWRRLQLWATALMRNKKQGIAFNYNSERRRARSRTPNRAAGEEKRKQQREKRKALFAAPKRDEPRQDPGVEGTSDDEPSNLVSAPKDNAWERTSWEQSSFDTSAEKAKFLRLMGAEKDKESSSEAQPSKAVPGPAQELERQYWQGMQKQLYSRGRGLG
ncbi:Maneal [Symbiodinium natans]|uniref:Maneal protein n=1 Tax=Symbiodinium natans TaxID=878477 RepID=A0A812S1T9_9DINO|nr:Maneal [Symbiodinium natans]